MSNPTITFELATHQLSRVALTIEQICLAIEEAAKQTHPLIHHYALNNLADLLLIIEKPELKSRFLKELVRIEHQLSKNITADNKANFTELYLHIHQLSLAAGRFTNQLSQDTFLQMMMQNINVQKCEATIPAFIHHWLNRDAIERQNYLKKWLSHLVLMQETVSIYLKILREHAQYQTIHLTSGFYQQTIPPKMQCHLILLNIDKSFDVIPKIQIGQHGLNIRLVHANSLEEINKDSILKLGISQI